MFSYEIRLLDEQDRIALVYMARCADDGEAKTKIRALNDYPYSRFEIWRDAEKIAEGR
jgi:hypothetical protein